METRDKGYGQLYQAALQSKNRSLAAFSAFIREVTSIEMIFASALILLFASIAVFFIFLGLSGFIKAFMESPLNKIQVFINDLQGILDTQFKKKISVIRRKNDRKW